jgi:ATP-binding cassette subfamily A (ABC1) protein 3
MDEADLLGDRIAIMADGRLMCSGSSLFLKSKYGVGYHLTLVRGPACDSRGLSELITSTVPGSQLASDVSAELTFLLPFTSSQHFPTLLDTLEQQRERFGFTSFGVSLTTLEEVFMKVGTGSTQIDDKVRGTGYQSLSQDEATEKLCAATKTEQAAAATGGATRGDIELQEIEQSGALVEEQKPATNYVRHTGIVLWFQQFMAMFLKRFYNSLRFYHAVITQLILPLIFIILALLIVKLPEGSQGDDPKRTLTLSGGSLSNEADTFWAHFGPLPPTFSFENVSASDIHATKLEDITVAIQTIRNSVQNFTDPSECCGYEYQLLDKFCASQEVTNLEKPNCDRDFAYYNCQDCLSCRHATFSECPAPPELSEDDINSVHDLAGPLESDNTYVAEHLLRRAGDELPSVFFRRVQAGFVFGYDEHMDLSCLSSASPQYDFPSESDIPSQSDIPDIPSQIFSPTMENLTATIWYNNQPYHVVPAALNAYHNVLLRNIMKSNNWSITVNNHPLPRTLETQDDEEYGDSLLGLAVSIMASFGFTFFLSSFVVFPITERESKAKHLQFVSGVNTFSYWLANYAWDLVNAAIVVLITFIIFLAYQADGYKGVTSLSAVFLILVFTCFASIPLAYCFSTIFKSHLVAYGVFFLFYFFPPLILQITVLSLPGDTDKERRDRDIVHYVSLLHPGYGLQIGLLNIYITDVLTEYCRRVSNELSFTCFRFADDIYQFTYPGIGANLMYMALEGVALLFVMVLIEYSFFVPLVRRLIYNYRGRNDVTPHTPIPQGLDSDVHAEAVNVMEGQTDTGNSAVVIKNMSKVYRPHLSGCSIAPSKRAVNRICLAIPRGEFFGFVGVNGAGKTTTFSILTGDLSPSEGTAVIGGYDIRTDIRHVQQQIGYCPQFDALIERMTGRELLTMFARLRGIPERLISQAVEAEVVRLDLTKHASKQCGKYRCMYILHY